MTWYAFHLPGNPVPEIGRFKESVDLNGEEVYLFYGNVGPAKKDECRQVSEEEHLVRCGSVEDWLEFWRKHLEMAEEYRRRAEYLADLAEACSSETEKRDFREQAESLKASAEDIERSAPDINDIKMQLAVRDL